MKDEKLETQKRKGATQSRVPEDKSMRNSIPPADSNRPDTELDFPIEWISIAAYYIWRSDGEPEGRDVIGKGPKPSYRSSGNSGSFQRDGLSNSLSGQDFCEVVFRGFKELG